MEKNKNMKVDHKINSVEEDIEELSILKEEAPNESAINKKKASYKIERTGKLKNEVQLQLNTMDSQLLFSGNEPNFPIGLLRFAHQMAEVWIAAENDDPYADLYLLRVYDRIMKAYQEIAAAITDYEQQLLTSATSNNLTIKPFISEKPLIKTLWFRTQYGYLGANLIANFDRLMRIVLTAYRVGIILNKPYEVIRDEWASRIKEIFELPFKWQKLDFLAVVIQIFQIHGHAWRI